jgi:dihydrofolate synthase/folylpolyglutamate synthase
VPGRLERIAEHPPTYLDAAHNPDGAAALAEALSALVEAPPTRGDPPSTGVAGGRRVVACLAILADKDAEAMLARLSSALDAAVCTEVPPAALQSQGRPGARSRPAGELAALCEAAGVPARAEPNLDAALAAARARAAEPPESLLLVTGSHYLLAPARQALAAS